MVQLVKMVQLALLVLKVMQGKLELLENKGQEVILAYKDKLEEMAQLEFQVKMVLTVWMVQ